MNRQRSDLTAAEERAIASLERLAKKWPRSLTLFSAAGSLVVVPTESDTTTNGNFEDHVLATIYGIPNDGGDPW